MSILLETRKTADSLIVSIPTKHIQTEHLEDLLSAFKAEIIAQKSEFTNEDAETLANEIKSGWWKKNRSRILDLVKEND
jgi:hypothetical protein